MIQRGQIFWATFLPPDRGRPVLILTREVILPFLSTVTVAPITSNIRDIASEVLLTPEDDGVALVGAVNLDNIQTIEQRELGNLLTALFPQRMQEVERALCFALGVDTNLLA